MITPLDIAAFVTRNIMNTHKDDMDMTQAAADAYRANTVRITRTVAESPREALNDKQSNENPFES